jgi:uncharacterized protein (DUF433 family)
MKLPDFLEADDGGFISIVGHRIGLHHVIRIYKEGYSAEMIQLEYPTLSLATIHKVLAYYLENRAEVDNYCAGEEAAFEAQVAAANQKPKSSPTLAEMRKRFEAMQRAAKQRAETR